MDARALQRICKSGERVRSAENGVHGAEIQWIVKVPGAVGGVGRTLVFMHRVQPEDIDAEVGQVVDLSAERVESAHITEPGIDMACSRSLIQNAPREPVGVFERLRESVRTKPALCLHEKS